MLMMASRVLAMARTPDCNQHPCRSSRSDRRWDLRARLRGGSMIGLCERTIGDLGVALLV